MKLKNPAHELLNEAFLESKLSTTILSYDISRILPTPAFRIRINKTLLHNALTHARANDCVADIRHGPSKPSHYKPVKVSGGGSVIKMMQQSLKVTSWNCRGLLTGILVT